MLKERREREREREKEQGEAQTSCVFPRGETSPWSSARQQCKANWCSRKAGIEISDLDRCLWNNKTSKKPGNTSLHTPYNHNSSPLTHNFNSREVLSGINLCHGGSLGSQCRQQSAWDFMYPWQQLDWLRFVAQSHSPVLGWAPACRLKQQALRLLKHLTGLTGVPDRGGASPTLLLSPFLTLSLLLPCAHHLWEPLSHLNFVCFLLRTSFSQINKPQNSSHPLHELD